MPTLRHLIPALMGTSALIGCGTTRLSGAEFMALRPVCNPCDMSSFERIENNQAYWISQHDIPWKHTSHYCTGIWELPPEHAQWLARDKGVIERFQPKTHTLVTAGGHTLTGVISIADLGPKPISLTMPRAQVEAALMSVSAKDCGDAMQALGTAPRGWMWYSPLYAVTVETLYDKNDQLAELHIWDWQGRKHVAGYHHKMEYLDARSATFHEPPQKHEISVIKVVNEGGR